MDLITLAALLHESTTCDCPLCAALAPHLEEFARLLLAGPTHPSVWPWSRLYSFVAQPSTIRIEDCVAVQTPDD